VFETGAILVYLAQKTNRFLPTDLRGFTQTMQWVMWQVSGLGPMLGQHGHFALYAQEKIAYAIERYRDEAARLYRVLDTQLGKTGAYVAGAEYGIADIACFPWTMTHKAQGFTLDDFSHIKRWYASVRAGRKCKAGLAVGKFEKEPLDDEARKNMFGQKAKEMAHRMSPNNQRGNTMIEFFFDCSSPWTYLAFHNIQPLADELGVEVTWRPILVGGIFNTINPTVYASRETPVPQKARYLKKDLADWARSTGLAIKMPPTVFPVNSVKAMRGCVWLGNDMVPFARAIFEAYWGEDQDISQDSVLTHVCQRVGIDPAHSLQASASRRSRISSRPTPMRWSRAAALARRPSLWTRPTCISATTACR
jgi:GST-like protein